MSIDHQLSEAETLRHELRMLRRKIAGMTDRRLFDGVDTLLSVAERQLEQVIITLRRETRL